MTVSRTTSEGVVRLPPTLETFVLAAVGVLSSTILLKVAAVQYLELIELALLIYVGFRFARTDFRLSLSKPMFRLAVGYGIFCGVAVLSGAVALTRPFYLDVYGLYNPGYVTAARIAELIFAVTATILLTEVFRRNPAKCVFTMKMYFWAGALSCFLSDAECPLSRIYKHRVLFTANSRASGFFNEGGPFGLYAISVVLTGWLLAQAGVVRHRRFYIAGIACAVAAIILSQSKAAVVAVILLFAIQAFVSTGTRQRVTTILIACAVLLGVVSFTHVSAGIEGYLQAGRSFETISHFHENDPNFSYGRVAGIFFVPRMVAQHPWLGVGWGNYGLVRNAPEYRGNAVAATFFDQAGLGILGLSAELGIPMTLLLIYLTFKPAILSHRLTDWRPVLNLALVQPVVHLCGAQMNVTYPWIVSAFALGMAGIAVPARKAARVGPHARQPSMPLLSTASPSNGTV